MFCLWLLVGIQCAANLGAYEVSLTLIVVCWAYTRVFQKQLSGIRLQLCCSKIPTVFSQCSHVVILPWTLEDMRHREEHASVHVTSTCYCCGRYAPKPQFSTPKGQYTAFLEALLVGHEDWVHSVQWQPPQPPHSPPKDPQPAQPLCLLSTSMDRTMMLWRPDSATGLILSSHVCLLVL